MSIAQIEDLLSSAQTEAFDYIEVIPDHDRSGQSRTSAFQSTRPAGDARRNVSDGSSPNNRRYADANLLRCPKS